MIFGLVVVGRGCSWTRCRRRTRGCRYPAEVIAQCVWLYHRFPLSFREVEELMLARGAIVSYETIRQWCAKFGPTYARALRRRRPRAGDKWHLDEVFVKINGERHYLWRAVDQYGNVPDILVQSERPPSPHERQSPKPITVCDGRAWLVWASHERGWFCAEHGRLGPGRAAIPIADAVTAIDVVGRRHQPGPAPHRSDRLPTRG